MINQTTTVNSSSGDPVVPYYLDEGDLMFMDLKPGYSWKSLNKGNSNDHVAMYMGDNTFIESDHSGVHNRSYGDFFEYYQNFTYWEVDATELEKSDAIDFAINQLGSSYQYCNESVRKIADPDDGHWTADIWYCSELVWAAYYSASDGNIDIDQNDWSIIPWGIPAVSIGTPLVCTTNDITQDGLVDQLP